MRMIATAAATKAAEMFRGWLMYTEKGGRQIEEEEALEASK